MNEELKPCPFCGSENILLIKNWSVTKPWCVCNDCQSSNGVSNTIDEAIEAWNKRVQE